MQRLPRSTGRSALRRRRGEAGHVGAHRLCEGLQEGAAAGGARLVDGDRVDGAVADLQVLHVLSADVDHGGHAGGDVLGGPVVRHGLDFALVDVQRGTDQALAVPGDAGAGEVRCGRKGLPEGADDVDGRGDGIATIGRVVGEADALVGVQQDGLDGGGAGVDAEEAGPGGLGEIRCRHRDPGVPLEEVGPLGLVGEQGSQGRADLGQRDDAAQRGRGAPLQCGPFPRRAVLRRSPRTAARSPVW